MSRVKELIVISQTLLHEKEILRKLNQSPIYLVQQEQLLSR